MLLMLPKEVEWLMPLQDVLCNFP